MAEKKPLTEKQSQIYEFIRESIDRNGFPPTIREIGDVFKIQSPNGVMCHLRALEKKRLIERSSNCARAIRLCDHKPSRQMASSTSIPFLGNVAAGLPIAAEEQSERLELSSLFAGNDHYVLRVRGQSMIDSHIDDGDLVIIRRRETAENGERVVAKVDGEVTLKRFYKKPTHIELIPENGSMEPIIVGSDQEVQIIGVLVGVIRKC